MIVYVSRSSPRPQLWLNVLNVDKRWQMFTTIKASFGGAEHWAYGPRWCYSSSLPFSQLLSSKPKYVVNVRCFWWMLGSFFLGLDSNLKPWNASNVPWQNGARLAGAGLKNLQFSVGAQTWCARRLARTHVNAWPLVSFTDAIQSFYSGSISCTIQDIQGDNASSFSNHGAFGSTLHRDEWRRGTAARCSRCCFG